MPYYDISPRTKTGRAIEKGAKAITYPLVTMTQTPSETKSAWEEVNRESPGGLYFPFAPNLNVKALAKALWGSASAVASHPGFELVQPLQIRAFHGSPYKFNKFKNEAISTGEGAQAFGYGHYLTESPEVAKTYYKAGRGKVLKDIYKDPAVEAAVRWYHSGEDVLGGTKVAKEEALRRMDYLIDEQKKYIEKWGVKNFQKRYQISEPEKHLGYLEDVKKQMIEDKLPTPGAIYETTIHKGKKPSEYTYLEWDKPISDDIAKKIESLPFSKTKNDLYNEILQGIWPDGETLYKRLANEIGYQEASKQLNQIGISGIKYPTGSLSGIKGSKKYNYVVFNPEDITIEKVR